jgi:hypothetical protein
MVDQGIKSRPVYGPIGLDAAGRRHLLVVDAPAVPADCILDDHGPFPEVWTVVRDGRHVPNSYMTGAQKPGQVHAFRSATLLLAALGQRLARETMGFRLYAAGSETFLADVGAAGAAAGLSRSEMAFAHAGSRARRIYCVHCRTITEGVVTNLFSCTGCGVTLFVRDHFSARMAAFMGVQADAEAPGELPPAETLYE